MEDVPVNRESLRTFRRYWIVPVVLTLGSWIYGLVEWPHMPVRMVVHKTNFVGGTPNGWEPRFWGLFGTPVGETLSLILLVLLVELHAHGKIAFNGDKRGRYASGKWIAWAISLVLVSAGFGIQMVIVAWNR